MPKRAFAGALAALAGHAWAGGNNAINFLSAVPTLDEIGLGALIALVAGVAGLAVRHRSRK